MQNQKWESPIPALLQPLLKIKRLGMKYWTMRGKLVSETDSALMNAFASVL